MVFTPTFVTVGVHDSSHTYVLLFHESCYGLCMVHKSFMTHDSKDCENRRTNVVRSDVNELETSEIRTHFYIWI